MSNLDEFFEEPVGLTAHLDVRKTRRKTPKKNLEAGVVTECLIWLKQQGYYAERRNTGAVRTAQDFLLQFGCPGAADIFAVINGRHIEIECKRRDGKGRLSDSQAEFGFRMKEYNIPYFVVRSADELFEIVGALLLHWSR